MQFPNLDFNHESLNSELFEALQNPDLSSTDYYKISEKMQLLAIFTENVQNLTTLSFNSKKLECFLDNPALNQLNRRLKSLLEQVFNINNEQNNSLQKKKSLLNELIHLEGEFEKDVDAQKAFPLSKKVIEENIHLLSDSLGITKDKKILSSLTWSSICSDSGEVPASCGLSNGTLLSLNEKLRVYGSAHKDGWKTCRLFSDCAVLFNNNINFIFNKENSTDLSFSRTLLINEHRFTCIVYPQTKEIHIHDSLGIKERPVSREDQVRNVLKEYVGFDVIDKSVCVQPDNSHDCGVWAILIAYKVLKDPGFELDASNPNNRHIVSGFRELLHEIVFEAACVDILNDLNDRRNEVFLRPGGEPLPLLQEKFDSFFTSMGM